MARVMIADDSDEIRQLLSDALELGNHELVAQARDGIETIEKFKTAKPDVLLLDIGMPKKDGMVVLEEIRSSNPDAKIIMITAYEDQSTINRSSSAGAQAYLIKPFDYKNVLKAIAMVMS